MKATSSSAPQNEHPPLARDAQGNLLPVPEGTCAWRIYRRTKGRPRIINGPDKQPARFPLDTTAEDLEGACGADTYRVYALDEVGNVIDYVTTVETSRELRNEALWIRRWCQRFVRPPAAAIFGTRSKPSRTSLE